MKQTPTFEWFDTLGLAVCTIYDSTTGQTFIGEANCHPDDSDFKSEKTGCEIALSRAKINSIAYERDQIKAELKALNQLYYSINKSKKFNPNSYEAYMIRRQINNKEFELDGIKTMLANEKDMLREYLRLKEGFYTSVRTRRSQLEAVKDQENGQE